MKRKVVKVTRLQPTRGAALVSTLFGHPLPVLERRTMHIHGKPIASCFELVRGGEEVKK